MEAALPVKAVPALERKAPAPARMDGMLSRRRTSSSSSSLLLAAWRISRGAAAKAGCWGSWGAVVISG